MNTIELELNKTQVKVDDLTNEIKIMKLDEFDLEQVKNFKKFNYDMLIVRTDSYELHIKKCNYAIRIYSTCVRFTLRGVWIRC